MEALVQLIAAVAAFILEVTVHAVVFVFYIVMSIFSPRYREKLRDDWDASNWHRFGIVLGIGMYSVALIVALLFWIPALLWGGSEASDNDKKSSEKIEMSSEEIERIKNTKAELTNPPSRRSPARQITKTLA